MKAVLTTICQSFTDWRRGASIATRSWSASEPTAALDGPLGRQVMEPFAKIAHERQAGGIVVTHDHRTLDVFDLILDVEDGMIQIRASSPSSSP